MTCHVILSHRIISDFPFNQEVRYLESGMRRIPDCQESAGGPGILPDALRLSGLQEISWQGLMVTVNPLCQNRFHQSRPIGCADGQDIIIEIIVGVVQQATALR